MATLLQEMMDFLQAKQASIQDEAQKQTEVRVVKQPSATKVNGDKRFRPYDRNQETSGKYTREEIERAFTIVDEIKGEEKKQEEKLKTMIESIVKENFTAGITESKDNAPSTSSGRTSKSIPDRVRSLLDRNVQQQPSPNASVAGSASPDEKSNAPVSDSMPPMSNFNDFLASFTELVRQKLKEKDSPETEKASGSSDNDVGKSKEEEAKQKKDVDLLSGEQE